MGIISCLFKSKNNPTNRTNGSSYSFLLCVSSSWRIVNERSTM
ncbi:hypothetical protein [Mycoplasmopsis californica]|nr:hypothetical protein [Mycoplasmopsis californica]